MKTILTIILVLIMLALAATAIFGAPIPLPNEFKQEMNQVEASGRKTNVPKGDKGLARGPFQIHEAYWKDAIEYDRTIGGTYADCDKYEYSVKIVTAYLNRYGRQYIITRNYEALARIHNGGPTGRTKSETLAYWRKYKFARSNGRG